MLMDRAGIAQLIPHGGDMCLLDGLQSWDAGQIQCTTMTHRALDNPLRRDGQLGILCGVEYAAQAMALHAALIGGAGGGSHRGYLASLRAVSCHDDRLDLIPSPLIVKAIRVHGDTSRAIYGFTLWHETRVVLEGRAAVVLEAA